MEYTIEILELKEENKKLEKKLKECSEFYEDRWNKTCETNRLLSTKLGYYKRKHMTLKTRVENLLKIIDLNEEPEKEDLELMC